MMLENRAPYPVERTLLTSGMTLAAVESLHRGESAWKPPRWPSAIRLRRNRCSGGIEAWRAVERASGLLHSESVCA